MDNKVNITMDISPDLIHFKDLVKDILMENKDLIIEKAAHELALSMARSKTVREKFGDRLEELLDGNQT